MKETTLLSIGDVGSRTVRFLSGEFLLKHWANSGTVVLTRSIMVTFCVYGAALSLREVTAPNSEWWTLSFESFLTAIHETVPWLGAIFAGSYVALYSRFSSQWTYLAGLYNQILQSEATPQPDSETAKKETQHVHAVWWAGFIEDALELHLATKPVFATLIRYLLTKRPEVRDAFERGVPGGAWRVIGLLRDVEAVCERTIEKWREHAEKSPLPRGLSNGKTLNKGAAVTSIDHLTPGSISGPQDAPSRRPTEP